MSTQDRISVGSARVRKKHALLFVLTVVIAMFPFPLSSMGSNPGSFFLGLPPWYWTALVLVVAIYVLIAVILRDLNIEEKEAVDRAASTGATAGEGE